MIAVSVGPELSEMNRSVLKSGRCRDGVEYSAEKDGCADTYSYQRLDVKL